MNTASHIQHVFDTYGVVISIEMAENIFTRCNEGLKNMIHASCMARTNEQVPVIWQSIILMLTSLVPPTAASSIEYNALFFDCFYTAMNKILPSHHWMLKEGFTEMIPRTPFSE
ncbi:hypothetical protein [Deminuibacter soli]|nr:hypothetical protein [Deminuibacter soli]